MIYTVENVDFHSSNFHLHITNKRDLTPFMHSHEFYEFNAMISGECTQNINGQSLTMKASEIIFLRPEDNHQFLSQTPDANVLAFAVKCHHMENFFSVYGKIIYDYFIKSPVPVINFGDQSSDIFSKAYSALLSPDADNREMHCNALLGAIVQFVISKIIPLELNKSYLDDRNMPSPIEKVLKQMSDPALIAEGTTALERLSGYSRPHLCRIFKEFYNITPHEYIRKQRMNLAHSLIIQSELSISTIAEQVGYLNNSHFISTFKQEYGMTPYQFRKHHYKTDANEQ